jgi:hypothetical protein
MPSVQFSVVPRVEKKAPASGTLPNPIHPPARVPFWKPLLQRPLNHHQFFADPFQSVEGLLDCFRLLVGVFHNLTAYRFAGKSLHATERPSRSLLRGFLVSSRRRQGGAFKFARQETFELARENN